jgi:hypothetical protein
MPDFPIDPELRVRATPPIILRRTTEAVDFIRKVALSSSDRAWQDVLQSFEAARDEWNAMEAVVHLELLLEARGLLVEGTACASRSGQGRSRATDQRGRTYCLNVRSNITKTKSKKFFHRLGLFRGRAPPAMEGDGRKDPRGAIKRSRLSRTTLTEVWFNQYTYSCRRLPEGEQWRRSLNVP